MIGVTPVTATEQQLNNQPIPGAAKGSYELKIAVPDALVAPVIAWARAHIPPDPHAEMLGGDIYHVRSLYFDNDAYDVFFQAPGFRQSKYRVRRYGDERVCYVERKSKTRGRVRKRRTPIPEPELAYLAAADAGAAWAGGWFRDRLQRARLRPRCQIAYQRLARVGYLEDAPIRLTLDRNIRCAPAQGLELGALDDRFALPIERNVLELKFRVSLPRLFKELIQEFSLSPDSASKYRLAVRRCGLAGENALEPNA